MSDESKNNESKIREHNSPIGHTWEEVERETFTPEEIAASNLRVAMMVELVNARQERGIS